MMVISGKDAINAPNLSLRLATSEIKTMTAAVSKYLAMRYGIDSPEFNIVTFNGATTNGSFVGGFTYGGTSQNLRIHQLVANYPLTINSPNCVIDSMV